MEPVRNKDLKKLLYISIFLGFSIGCLYVVSLQHYYFKIPDFNLEILQNFEIVRSILHSNKTRYVDDKRVVQQSKEIVTEENDIVIKQKKGLQNTVKESNENITLVESTTENTLKEDAKKGKENQKETVKNAKNETLRNGKEEGDKRTEKSKEKQLPIEQNERGKLCEFDKTKFGRIFVDASPANLMALKEEQLNFVQNGGQWSPSECTPRAELAVIIPYRRRETHLGIFLRHMHKFLKAQMIHYRIFVIEQDDEYDFNRGKLMNIGYKEALAKHPFTCFVFHDVDLLPEDARNDYACPHSPRHLSVAVDKFNYELIYEELFGGIEMFRTQDYKTVNGFSNSFWGWGGEDDNLYFRVMSVFGKITRPSMKVGRYKMLKHFDMENFRAVDRIEQLATSKNSDYIATDGLSSLQYKVKRELELPLFTLIKVDLQMHKDRLFGTKEYF